jgi:hypothetical protein
MSDVTRVLDAAAAADRRGAAELLPLVCAELRRLAAARFAEEKPGRTLRATALVHEAYPRLVGPVGTAPWQSRGRFFAAAEAMRRILIYRARGKRRLKREGDSGHSLRCGSGPQVKTKPRPGARPARPVA